VILPPSVPAWRTERNPLCVFLSGVIKGLFAAVAPAPWLVWIFSDSRKGLQRNNSSSKGATP
jgi:hypothetical protein